MATAEAALQKRFIKLQTEVSIKHNDVKKLLLQNPNNKKLLCEKKMSEQLMKSWNFYLYYSLNGKVLLFLFWQMKLLL